MAAFLHGIEIIESNVGPQPVLIVKAGVIGLIGTAPSWAVAPPVTPPAPNTPTLVSGKRDAAQFGPLIQGYTIPYALQAIQEQGAGQAIVINVFDITRHNTAVASRGFVFPASGPQVINLGRMGIVSGSVVVKNQAGSTTYVENTDYTVDYINGLIYAKSGGAITVGETVEVANSYADPTLVSDADIIGAITSGVYTGMQALLTTFNLMGFFAKILIAPGFSQEEDVATALIALSNTIRARALIDSPPSTQVATAISNRGTAGNPFDTSSPRAVLCFPQQQFYDTGLVPTGVTIDVRGNPVQAQANAESVQPYSQWLAGVWAYVIANFGYWYSPSNYEIEGVDGPDVSIYMNPFDSNSDDNNLNAAGIVTIINAFGTGIRTWGNRAASFPTETAPENFLPIRLTLDVIEESVQLFMMTATAGQDKPINNALITDVLQSINGLIHTLVQRGALMPGSAASYDPNENPPSELAAGHITFDFDCMPPPPAERITWNFTIDTSLLANLGVNQSGTVPAA
jgi:phage tail sheath protein FI